MGMNRKSHNVTKKLLQINRCLVASKNYLKTHIEPTTPQELADWDWLELSPTFHIKPVFRKNGGKPVTLKPGSQISSNDARALFHLVRSGAGIAIVPELLTEDEIASGDVTLVLPDWDLEAINVFAEWPSNAPRNGLIRLFVNKLAEDLN